MRDDSTAAANPITIVVPIYDDIPSLLACISSVIDTVDLSKDSLLLVNDCGPQVDDVERAVLTLVTGIAGVTYTRNDANLGFVGTCNRAVFELDATSNDILLLNSDARLTVGAVDEMRAVLALDEKHGVVFPRSNNAAIASVPLIPFENTGSEEEYSLKVYEGLSKAMPRYSVTPVAVGFCYLVRRQLTVNYGFFDPIYAPGYSEENDFCLRVNRYGFSSIMANHALVYHEGSKSFATERRLALQERNEAQMIARYPYYQYTVAHYLQFTVDPLEWFSDRLFGGGRKKVLIDLHHVSLIYNGSTRNALTFLELLKSRATDLDIEFVIVSSTDAIKFFDLDSYGFRTVPNGELVETFDLGFALSPVSFATQINVLNRHAVKWVVSHFDVIALRMNSLLEIAYIRRQVVLDSLVHADRVIPISNAALDDIEAYFGPAANGVRAHSTVIHEGAAESSFTAKVGFTAAEEMSLTAGQLEIVNSAGYVLVVGNIFTHKQMPETLAALEGLGVPVLAFGSLTDATQLRDAVMIEGGHLSDDEVALLYRNAGCVVFPSSYEGFGLPMVEAGVRGRPLIVFDTAVAREVADSLGIADLTTYFSRFDALAETVNAALASPAASRQANRELRSLDLYNDGILQVLLEELASPVDLERLRARVTYFRTIEVYSDALEVRIREILDTSAYRIMQRLVPRLEPLRPMVRFARRVVRKVRR